jgi:transcriptional regulator with GAF, ATPase, and Fis domain
MWRAVFDGTRGELRSDWSYSMSDQTPDPATPDPATPDPATSAAAVAELQQLLLALDNVDEFLQQVAHLATEVLPSELSCGVTMRRDHRPITVASSDARASQVDEIQYHYDNGPCLAALNSGERVLIDDLAADGRWQDYQMPALAHGIRSSLSLPLHAEQKVVGALNLYATRARAFGSREQTVASGFADEASRALTLALRLVERAEMSQNLQHALASRAVIDQALGIVMGQNRCSADAAFDILRTTSQNRNVKLRDIAAAMVTAVSGHAPPSDGRFN